MGGLTSVIDQVLPDLATNKAFLETLRADLGRIRIFDHPGFNSVMSDTGLRAGRGTTEGPRRAPAEARGAEVAGTRKPSTHR